jgi:hypothetical protein
MGVEGFGKNNLAYILQKNYEFDDFVDIFSLTKLCKNPLGDMQTLEAFYNYFCCVKTLGKIA